VAVAAAGIVALAAPIIGVVALAATATVVGAIVLNEIAEIKMFNGESIKDKIKEGYRKIKGWFK